MAPPDTDIWRKPPSTDVYTAPLTQTHKMALRNFQSARITFRADWTERYDQAGMLMSLRSSGEKGQIPSQWLKAGVELYQGEPMIGHVACDRWADWSLYPLSLPGDGWVTLEMERSNDELGRSLWLYLLGEDGKRKPLREVNWILAAELEGKDVELELSAYAARPAKVDGGLEVRFQDFRVQRRS